MLSCESISKAFDGVDVLSDVTLSFPPSGVIAIIGPNGAGKTTLLNVLTGFVRVDAGRCFAGSVETTSLKPYEIARLGVARTFQDLRLILQLSCLENVLLARPAPRGERLLNAWFRVGTASEERTNRQFASGCLQLVGLDSKAGCTAGELSYGEQKLLTLACCLATDASVVILDEPVAGVQPLLIDHVLAHLDRLRKEKKLVILVEHDLATVRVIADQVIVLSAGRVIAEGTPQEVFNRPHILEVFVG
jgi:neutral amino acid transport system ATP-binding protein